MKNPPPRVDATLTSRDPHMSRLFEEEGKQRGPRRPILGSVPVSCHASGGGEMERRGGEGARWLGFFAFGVA
jgi:hypothetical protein